MGAVQFLYSWNVQEQSIDESDGQILIDSDVLIHGDLAYLQKLLKAIPPKISKIDAILKTAIQRDPEMIDPVELAILRLGIYELTSEKDIPLKVITNECIELSREFGNPYSYKFINGALDKLAFSNKTKVISQLRYSNKRTGPNEHEIIKKYFSKPVPQLESVIVGIGDDCALIEVPNDQQLLVSTDTLLENVHFPNNTDATDIGYKSLAVSLSDIAAKGGRPMFATLNLSLSEFDQSWLESFSQGFFELASKYNVQLIGGDTVKGPLGITVTAYGFLDKNRIPLRGGAKIGDAIYVTGTLGDAALGLASLRQEQFLMSNDHEYLQKRLDRPIPRVDAGIILGSVATAAIDISDGLMSDLKHVLDASKVGAVIDLESIPLSKHYRKYIKEVGWDYALTGGDDYEILFTMNFDEKEELIFNELWNKTGVIASRIGTIREKTGIEIRQLSGEIYKLENYGYSHF